MANFVAHIPEWFPTRKAAQVVAFFADQAEGSINVLRATKLVYLADRLSMERYEYPITGDNFVSMPFGPVNTYTYSYMCGKAAEFTESWSEFIGARDGNYIPLTKEISRESLDELSDDDIAVLRETWEKFKDIDRFELAEWTHRFCPEWRDPRGSSIPIDFSAVYQRLNKKDAAELAEEIQAERSLRLELAGKEGTYPLSGSRDSNPL